MADTKTAYFIDRETLLHNYDYEVVSADENGNFALPDNATWIEPKRGENEFFIHARWNPAEQAWEEGGVAPLPSPEPVDDIELLRQQLAAVQKQNLTLIQQVATLSKSVQSLVLAQATKIQ